MNVDQPRITVLTGHYGSGKSELSIQLALRLAEHHSPVALADVDVVNPYFRSRERRALLERHGVRVIASNVGFDRGVDLPAVSAEIYAPLRDGRTRTVIDSGGDPVGARVLASFRRMFDPRETDVLCVVNVARPQTATAHAVIDQIDAIQHASGLTITGLINNTHLLEQTERAHVEAGNDVCCVVSERTGLPIRYVGVTQHLWHTLPAGVSGEPIPIAMHLREAWMNST
ncbi:MAG: ATP-binding protein [Spirochaetaceae bacterium]|nr:MAG: ATP-binding protein [Spirochaetaceae bacterium]